MMRSSDPHNLLLEKVRLLQKKLLVYKGLLFSFVFLFFISLGWIFFQFNDEIEWRKVKIEKSVPHAKKIAAIITPLKYTGLYDFLKKDVTVRFDFQNRRWYLTNIHEFDKSNNLILAKRQYGLCGDLAVYTYQKIRPLFDDSYDISFVRVAESGYFWAGKGSHVILKITDKTLPKNFPHGMLFLDPALRRYGTRKMFDEYIIGKEITANKYIQSVQAQRKFPIEGGPPIKITRKFMMSFSVLSIDGVFDKDNFKFTLFASKRYSYLYPTLFEIEKKDGKVQMQDYPSEIRKIIGEDLYQKARARLISLFEELNTHLTNSNHIQIR